MTTTIKQELLDIHAASSDGKLHAHEVVKWAESHPGSALHAAIDWNDKTAAHQHRLWQVRKLIEIHVTIAGPTHERFVSLSIDRPVGGGYRNMADVLQAQDLTQIMLRDALRELERMQEKYRHINELADVWAAVDKIKSRRSKPGKKAA